LDERSLHYNNIRFTIAVRRGAGLPPAAIHPKESIIVLHANPPFVLLCLFIVHFGCKLLNAEEFNFPECLLSKKEI